MHRNSLFAVTRASLPLGLLLASACAQAAVVAAQSPPTDPPGKSADPRLSGLPDFLLMVPGGTVEVGLTADELVQAACQVVNPTRPEMAPNIGASKIELLMKQSASLLGQKKVDVEPFLLARTPVTCAQWERFVERKRKAGQMRPPFDWWRYGREDDYNEKLPDVVKEFPGEELGPVLYWQRHGHELPYSLTLPNGTSMADWPVANIDYREANEFAASLGMRLPTEAEWTRAARGDGSNMWPWGDAEQAPDAFREEALENLRIAKSRDKDRKPVGTVDGNAGPFGHADMFGHVWQFVAGRGNGPINGEDPWKDEWKRLQKDKVGKLLTSPPLWKDEVVLAKGGSYLSAGEPIQLLVDARAPLQTIEVFPGVGLRLAKSLRPGYDMLFSLLRSTFNRDCFVRGQEIDLAQQIGVERYELGADGFPSAYEAISFAPVNWLAEGRSSDLRKLLEATQEAPLLIGTLATSMPLAEPSVPAGHYSVLFRQDGMPRELVEAIKTGHREMVALAKKPKKDGDEEKDDKPKKNDWRSIVQRYGLTEDDVAKKEAANGLKFVRIDGLEIPTDHDVFLLHDNEGKVTAAIRAPNKKFALAGGQVAPQIEIDADDKGRMVVRITTGAPPSSENTRRAVAIPFHVTLDRAAASGDDAWRTPPQ